MLDFRILATRGEARLGRLVTPHGEVATPAFLPVATLGSVKGITPAELEELGAEMVLANAYHLAQRPGIETVEALGGLHAFMGWRRPVLTDSGGFQIFSLAALIEVGEGGIRYRSHVDGSEGHLGPGEAVRAQERLGADIAMALDECLPAGAPREALERAVERTTRWAEAGLDARRNPRTALFAIVQGGTDLALREESARALAALGFEGYAAGGLSVGEPAAATRRVARHTAACLPSERPRYLMGVGTPEDLLRFVAMGYDLFDCVLPTRNGRNGTLFTSRGLIMIRNARYARDPEPVDPACGCYTCRSFSRGYLRHLAQAGEMLAARLATLHNLHFYLELMATIRASLAAGRFAPQAERLLAAWGSPASGEEVAR